MRIAIIGGCGRMGQWMTRFLQSEGNEVIIYDPRLADKEIAARCTGILASSYAKATEKAAVVILSLPLDGFEDNISKIAADIKPGQPVIDISSIKGFTVSSLQRHIRQSPVLGVHPMFGPGAKGLAGCRVVLTPDNQADEKLADKARDYLVSRGAAVVSMSPQEHDDAMSTVLGLSHFIALASADALLAMDKIEASRQVAGSTYSLLLTLAGSVLSEEPELYAALQKHLPGAAVAERVFLEKAREWLEMTENKDSLSFVRRMKKLQDGFSKADPQFSRAYQEMYKLIDRH